MGEIAKHKRMFISNLTARIGSFRDLTEEQVETHCRITRYGDFILTEAVFPSYDLKVIPKTGMRHDTYYDGQKGRIADGISVVVISASREYLFELFMELVGLFRKTVDVVLESFYGLENDRNCLEFLREKIDLVVLESILWDFEDLLLRDGLSGISIFGSNTSLEVQFDNHKLLVIYNWREARDRLLKILKRYNIPKDPTIKFITEAEHVHQSSEEMKAKFEELKRRIGADGEPS